MKLLPFFLLLLTSKLYAHEVITLQAEAARRLDCINGNHNELMQVAKEKILTQAKEVCPYQIRKIEGDIKYFKEIIMEEYHQKFFCVYQVKAKAKMRCIPK